MSHVFYAFIGNLKTNPASWDGCDSWHHAQFTAPYRQSAASPGSDLDYPPALESTGTLQRNHPEFRSARHAGRHGFLPHRNLQQPLILERNRKSDTTDGQSRRVQSLRTTAQYRPMSSMLHLPPAGPAHKRTFLPGSLPPLRILRRMAALRTPFQGGGGRSAHGSETNPRFKPYDLPISPSFQGGVWSGCPYQWRLAASSRSELTNILQRQNSPKKYIQQKRSDLSI